MENPLIVKNIKNIPPYYPENSEIIHVVSSLGTSTTPFQYNFPSNYLGHYQHLVIYYTTLHYTTLVITMLHYSHTMVRCHLLLYHYYIVLLLLQGCHFIIVKKTHRLHNQNIASQTQKMSTKIKDLQSKALI